MRVRELDGIRHIELADPDRRNVLSPDLLARLTSAVSEPTDAGALLLTGEGPAFCAGFDLSLCRLTDGDERLRAMLTGLAGLVRALCAQPLPVVLCAHGAAVAGGCAILSGADVVVADTDARLGYPVVRLGITPAISAPFMASRLSLGAVRARLLDPQVISAERAHAIGMVQELTPSIDDALARAADIARELAHKPHRAVLATRDWLNHLSPAIHESEGLDASLSLVGSEESKALLDAYHQARDAARARKRQENQT